MVLEMNATLTLPGVPATWAKDYAAIMPANPTCSHPRTTHHSKPRMAGVVAPSPPLHLLPMPAQMLLGGSSHGQVKSGIGPNKSSHGLAGAGPQRSDNHCYMNDF